MNNEVNNNEPELIEFAHKYISEDLALRREEIGLKRMELEINGKQAERSLEIQVEEIRADRYAYSKSILLNYAFWSILSLAVGLVIILGWYMNYSESVDKIIDKITTIALAFVGGYGVKAIKDKSEPD